MFTLSSGARFMVKMVKALAAGDTRNIEIRNERFFNVQSGCCGIIIPKQNKIVDRRDDDVSKKYDYSTSIYLCLSSSSSSQSGRVTYSWNSLDS